MARGKAKVGAAQKLTGYGILAVLGLIAVWLLIQQSRFNPAVIVVGLPPVVVPSFKLGWGSSGDAPFFWTILSEKISLFLP